MFHFIVIHYLNFRTALDGSSGDGKESSPLHLGKPDDIDVSIELRNWLFALEGAQEMAEMWWFSDNEHVGREERCWHTTFQNLRVKAKSSPKNLRNGKSHGIKKYPIELVTVRCALDNNGFVTSADRH